MKNNFLNTMVGLVLLASGSAVAGDLQGSFSTEAASPLLRDSNGVPVTLVTGPMAVRLSNKSKSAVIKQSGREYKIDMPVWGGDSDLRNFYVHAEQIGQKVDLVGFTTDIVVGTYREINYVQCHLPPYYCRGYSPCYGTQRVEEVYEDWERTFTLELVDPALANKVVGAFKGYGERTRALRSRYPVSSCY